MTTKIRSSSSYGSIGKHVLIEIARIEQLMPANRRMWQWRDAIERLNLTILKLQLIDLGMMEDYKHHPIYAHRKRIRYAYVITEMDDGQLGGTFLSHFLDQQLDSPISLHKALSMVLAWAEHLKEALRIDVEKERIKAYGIEDRFMKVKKEVEGFNKALKGLEQMERELAEDVETK